MKRLFDWLGYFVFLALTTILLMEVFLRLVYPKPFCQNVTVRTSGADNDGLFSTQNLIHFSGNHVWMSPGVTAYIAGHPTSKYEYNIEFKVNSIGLRGKELDPTKPTKVLFLGDSITMASYLPEENSIPSQVEKELLKSLPVQVLNGGISGTGIRDYVDSLRRHGPNVQPRIIFIGYYLNDHLRFGLTTVELPPKILCPFYSFSSFWETWSQVAQFSKRGRDHCLLGRSITPTESDVLTYISSHEPNISSDPVFLQDLMDSVQLPDWGSAWSEKAVKESRYNLKLISVLAGQLNAQVFITVFPVYQQVRAKALFDSPQRTVKGIAESLGFTYVDTLELLRSSSLPPEALFFDQCHQRPPATELVSQAIANAMRTKLDVNSPSSVLKEAFLNTGPPQPKPTANLS